MTLQRIHSFLGTRRSAMIVIALFAICQGLTLWHDPGPPVTGQAILYLDLPLWLRVTGWAGSSLAAVVVAIWARPRWEWVGWLGLAIMPFERAFSHAWSFVAWLLPGGNPGTAWSIVYTGQWVCAILLLGLISSWREDSPRRLSITRDSGTE